MTTPTTPTTARNPVRPLRAGALALGLTGLLAASAPARAQNGAPADAAPKSFGAAAPEAPSNTRVFTRATSAWSMTQNTDGRSVTVRGAGGELSAEIDGKAVPADRIVSRGGRVTVTDEKGVVVFDGTAPGADVFTARPFGPRGQARLLSGPGPGGAWGAGGAAPGQPAEEPRVMIGVQLADPDAALRGHFGLGPDEATLVSAVYEGLPASAAGLEPYDLIVGVDGKSPASPDAVRTALRDREAGAAVRLEVLHKGQRRTVTVTPEKYDRERIERAKVSAIAAAESPADALALLGGPPGAGWSRGGAGKPFVGVFVGPDGQRQQQIFSALEQTDADRQFEDLARRLHDELARANAAVDGAGGAGDRINKLMEERMRRMEEMLQRMMDRSAAPASPAPPAPPAPAAPSPKAGSQS